MYSLEFQLPLSDDTREAVWSKDGRILLVVPFTRPAVYLIRVEQKQVREWPTPYPLEVRAAAISLNHDLLLLHQPIPRFNGLWVYSVHDGKEITRKELDSSGCRLGSGAEHRLTFSDDGSSVWVGCYPLVVNKRYPAAIRLSVPELQVQERLDLEPINASADTQEIRTITNHEGNTLWTEILSVRASTAPPRKIAHQFVRTIELRTRQELFFPFEIRAISGVGYNTYLRFATISPEQRIAVVFRERVKTSPPPPPGTPEFAFETYDTRDGRLIAEFWPPAMQDDPGLGGRVVHAALVPGTPYLVGATDAVLNPKHGGMLIWNAITGAVVARIEGPSSRYVSVSPDGERIALVTFRSLLVYRRTH